MHSWFWLISPSPSFPKVSVPILFKPLAPSMLSGSFMSRVFYYAGLFLFTCVTRSQCTSFCLILILPPLSPSPHYLLNRSVFCIPPLHFHFTYIPLFPPPKCSPHQCPVYSFLAATYIPCETHKIKDLKAGPSYEEKKTCSVCLWGLGGLVCIIFQVLPIYFQFHDSIFL